MWVVQGQPGRCNVYLIENPGEEGGVTLYDAGARTMTRAVATAGAKLGGITRVVLGHGHTDHRGVAPALGVPVLCHPDEVQDAEGSGGFRYWPADLAGLPPGAKQIQKLLHRYAWDGGPVKIADTVSEGDEVSGFRVVDLPGHAPGLIGLWRESDRLALVSDCFYTLDDVGPQLPGAACPTDTYNYDPDEARESIRKLAEMEPAAAWPGHAKPITGDVRGQLLQAAASRSGPVRTRCTTLPESAWASATAAGPRESGHDPDELVAPNSDYTDAHGAVLTLRGALSPATRREYAQVLAGTDGRPSASREDAWQRAVELLFERLAVRWVIAGAPIERQRELLLRFRAASRRGARLDPHGPARALRRALPRRPSALRRPGSDLTLR